MVFSFKAPASEPGPRRWRWSSPIKSLILAGLLAFSAVCRGQNINGFRNNIPPEENTAGYRLFQGALGFGEIMAVAGMFRFRQKSTELKAARDDLKANTDRLDGLRKRFAEVSVGTKDGLENRLKNLNSQLDEIQNKISAARLVAASSSASVSEAQRPPPIRALPEKKNRRWSLRRSKEAQPLPELPPAAESLQTSLREKLKLEFSQDPYILKVRMDSIKREIAEINEALRKGQWAGHSLEAIETETAAIARQIVTMEHMVDADAERISSIIRKLKSMGLFKRLKFGARVSLIGDALLIADAVPRIGYLLTFEDDPGFTGIDDTIVTAKRVIMSFK
jgi:hypothetical protein